MPNNKYFILSIIIMILSISSTLYLAIVNEILLTYLSIAIFIIGTILLLHWSTISYNWQCSKCGNILELTMWQNFIGMNIGTNRKYLFCSECNTKVPFNGIKKEILLK